MMTAATATRQNKRARAPFRPYGASLSAWRSGASECLLAGPADTGKSRTWLEKLHHCADKYPGMRGLIVRKTRHSLTQSAMVTYEKKVLPEGWLGNLIHFKTQEQQYEYPNGSILAVAGMDDPEKIQSSEWDIIYAQEATEISLDAWETMTKCLRNGVMPYQQLAADCNPSYPTHWLKARCDRGVTRMLRARHEDNPTITPERIARLKALTGVRRLRLYEGIWAAAEGMVYSEWSPDVHILSRERMKELGIFYSDGSLNRQVIRHVIGGVDWGFSNPGSLQSWGLDYDGRIYLLAEVYRTQRTDDWWVQQAIALNQEFHMQVWVADPSQPAYIRKFNEAGLYTIGAENALLPGITAMQSRLQLAGDGRPRLYVYEYALRERDELRDGMHQPVCFEGEINEYVWPKAKDGQALKEVPVKVNDHSLDTARYVCMYLEMGGLGSIELIDASIASELYAYKG
jgi:phage terminase large subunit-like protein